MVVLNESEWEIQGVRFGTIDTSGLWIARCELGEWTIDAGDLDNPQGYGLLPGIDRLRGATWSFDVGTAFTTNEVDAYATIAPLLNVWAKARNLAPGQVWPLRFCAGGRQLAVYGRPRRYSQPAPDLRSKLGKIVTTLDFLVTDPHIYQVSPDGNLIQLSQSVTLELLANNDTGGVLWDDPNGGADTEFWWDSNVSTPRAGLINNTSDGPVPFQVEIKGPIKNPVVWGSGWKFAFTGRGGLSIAYDQKVTVNTRSMTALLSNGASVAGYLSRDSRLSAQLQPGQQEVFVSGEDVTGTSRFIISWSPATATIAGS